MDSLQTKNMHLNNEIVGLKNKLSILEKTSDARGERGVESIRNLIIKVGQLSAYKTEVRRTKIFVHYSQEDLIRLFEREITQEETLKLFEYCKERGQSKVSNWGIM